MALKQLEAVGAFSKVPYGSSADWEMGPCSGCDWHVLDLFGVAPETVLLHSGTLEVAGDLSLDTPDGYGYYVIEGSLMVGGILKVEIDEMYNVIVVTGDLQAQALVVAWETQLYVLGNTTVTGPLLSELSDGGACYLNGKTVAKGLLDVGETPPWLGGKPDVLRMEIEPRYSSENCEDPMARMLEDLRAGRTLTRDISLETFDAELHSHLIGRWLRQPHVARWWGEPQSSDCARKL